MNDHGTHANPADELLAYLEQLPKGGGDANAHPLTYTNYSLKQYVRRDGGRIYGCWASSLTAACLPVVESFFLEVALIDMKDMGLCPHGDMIVMANHY